MFCNAMLFNLERTPKKDKPGMNNFLTFVDNDTGESFRTFVNDDVAVQYVKHKSVLITLSISMNEFNGRQQLQTRIITMVDVATGEVSTATRADSSNTKPLFNKVG